jgi:hypothetical protein
MFLIHKGRNRSTNWVRVSTVVIFPANCLHGGHWPLKWRSRHVGQQIPREGAPCLRRKKISCHFVIIIAAFKLALRLQVSYPVDTGNYFSGNKGEKRASDMTSSRSVKTNNSWGCSSIPPTHLCSALKFKHLLFHFLIFNFIFDATEGSR